jgi:hypothetical protein
MSLIKTAGALAVLAMITKASPSFPVPQSLRRNVTYTIPLTNVPNQTALYTAPFLIGGQHIDLVLSTVSEATQVAWVNCSGCTNSTYRPAANISKIPQFTQQTSMINLYNQYFMQKMQEVNDSIAMENGELISNNVSFFLIASSNYSSYYYFPY